MYLKSADLKDDAAERPDVGFVCVLFVFAQLGGEVEGGAGHCVAVLSALHQLGNPEIPNFEVHVAVDEDVLGLHVAMNDVHAVDVLHYENELENPGGDQALVKEFVIFLHSLDVVGQGLLYDKQVATSAKVHEQDQFVILNKILIVTDDVDVLQLF